MSKDNAVGLLRERIVFLEKRAELESAILRAEFNNSLEKLKPANILRNTFNDVVHSPEMRHKALNSVIGLVTGYLTEKLVVGKTYNPLKKVFGILLEAVVANKVAKNFDTIKDTGISLYNRLFAKKNTYHNN